MRRIAITGGIAEGKSTVLGYCRDAGYPTASADDMAREIFLESEVQSSISQLLGLSRPPEREEVLEAIARAPGFRNELNRLTHPRILSALERSKAVIIEVPLLVEACLLREFDRIWVVTCGVEEQRKRLAARVRGDLTDTLLAAQLPTGAKTPFADRIIRTNLSEDHVQRYVLANVKSDLGDLRSG